MNAETPTPEDLNDRLIDGALREVVGGETPPDLAEQILFAAAGEQSDQLVTLAPGTLLEGEKAMANQHRQAIVKRNVWIGITLAASLLLAAGLFLPGLNNERQGAQVTPENDIKEIVTAVTEPDIAKPDNNARLNLSATGGQKTDGKQVRGKNLGSDAPSNFDSLIDLIVDTVDEESWQNGKASGEPFPNNLEITVSQSLQVVEEVEPAEASELKQVAQGVAGLGTDLDTLPATGAAPIVYPEAEVWDELTNQRERYAAQQKSHQWSALSRRVSGLPTQEGQLEGAGKEANGRGKAFFFEDSLSMDVGGEAVQGGRGLGRGRDLADVVTDKKSLLQDADNSEKLDRTRGGEGKQPEDQRLLALRDRRREVARELNEKVDFYQGLAEGVSGAESPTANSALNMHIYDIRQTQQELLEAKEQLVELRVARAVAEQKINSTSAAEQAVQEELSKDPMLANFKAEEFALVQQIRAKKSKQESSAELNRLSKSLQNLKSEANKYRLEKERNIRTALRTGPNDVLAAVNIEYILRRNQAQEKIVKLKKDYQEKVAAIKQFGDRSGELALLQAEIELLQQQLSEQGKGPGTSGDKYTRIYENPFIVAEGEKAVSTFSIDVDTASYANVRQFLMQSGQLPPPDAVRIEELVNYFDYAYTAPTGDTPFAAHVEVAGCPWQAEHRLVRVGIKGREIEIDNRPQSNLVFLIDVSGSMNEPAKLPLLVEGMKLLTRELGENDRVAIVVYASSEGLALPSTRGDKQDTILTALEKLRAGGSTAGGAGIELAYKIAQENFIEGGVNRVILATDGDFNVGTTSTAELERLAETNAKETGVFLTVLGFGRGNLNDAMMEAISGKGNGNYHYVDNQTEARKVLVAELTGTLVTIAKDVKIQIEFNPAQVAGYRLIGYENRMLKTEDFNDDKKDAGEIGAGHTVTAIYEIVPAGQSVDVPAVDPLKYQKAARPALDQDALEQDATGELLTLKLRYKQPDGDKSTKVEFPITDIGQSFAEASDDFKFASAVASFGMLLRHSEHQGATSYSAVEEIAQEGAGEDRHGYRAEFLQLVRQARQLAGE